MSAKFNMIKVFYARGQWNISKVRDAVEKGWITAAEFTLITGEEY